MSKFWTKTIFWENVKKSIAVFSGPVTYGIHELEAADGWVLLSAGLSFAGAILAIWATDNDKDGIVDIFQANDRP